MKNIIYLLAIFISLSAFGQVGIGNDSPDASSMLDIQSTEAGILIPRMTTAQRNLITSPANGLMIFNTDTDELQYNSNSAFTPVWQALDTAPASTSTIGQSIKYSNTDITTDVNEAAIITAPLLGTLEWNDNTTLYTANTTTNQITINETGRYKIVVNMPLTTSGTTDRMSPEMRISLGGTEVGTYSSTGYIRTASNHQETSLHITEILEITTGQTVSVNIVAAANRNNNASNDVTIRSAGSANIYIEKLM